MLVDDDTGIHLLLYAVFDSDNNLLKIGYTTNIKSRQTCYDNPNLEFVILVHLHWLDAATEQYLQQKYSKMLNKIQTLPDAPEPIKQLFHTIVDGGDKELECMRKIIHLMCKLGSSLHYSLCDRADFLM